MPGQPRKITDAAGREVWVDAAGNEIRDVTPNHPAHENDLGSLQAAAAKRGTGRIPAHTSETMKKALEGLRVGGLVPSPKRGR